MSLVRIRETKTENNLIVKIVILNIPWRISIIKTEKHLPKNKKKDEKNIDNKTKNYLKKKPENTIKKINILGKNIIKKIKKDYLNIPRNIIKIIRKTIEFQLTNGLKKI